MTDVSTSQQSDTELDVEHEIVHNKGDIILRSGAKHFQVSSKILAFASPYFETMFSSEFAEGRALQSSTAPLSIDLHEDNPKAMEILLHIIHFSTKHRYLTLDVDLQFDVAVLSDKYDCTNALHSDSKLWLMSVDTDAQLVPSLWKLAAVAFLMHHPKLFAQQTKRLVQVLRIDDFGDSLPLSSLPHGLREILQSTRIKLLDEMIEQVEKAIDCLRKNSQRFDMPWKICNNCGVCSRLNASQCNCVMGEHAQFRTLQCDAGSRLCAFLERLNKKGMWPLSKWRKDTAANFLSSIKSVLPQSHYRCSMDTRCPLFKRSESLKKRLETIMKRYSNVEFSTPRFEGLPSKQSL